MDSDDIMTPVDQANDVWDLHWFCGEDPDRETLCLALVVDDRYLVDPRDGSGEQFRVLASFGENPFPMGMKRGFLSPEPIPSNYVLGLHLVGTLGEVIRLYDQWAEGPFDADASEGDPARGEELARALLASLHDERYARLANPSGNPHKPQPIAGSSPFPLESAIFKSDDEP